MVGLLHLQRDGHSSNSARPQPSRSNREGNPSSRRSVSQHWGGAGHRAPPGLRRQGRAANKGGQRPPAPAAPHLSSASPRAPPLSRGSRAGPAPCPPTCGRRRALGGVAARPLSPRAARPAAARGAAPPRTRRRRGVAAGSQQPPAPTPPARRPTAPAPPGRSLYDLPRAAAGQ